MSELFVAEVGGRRGVHPQLRPQAPAPRAGARQGGRLAVHRRGADAGRAGPFEHRPGVRLRRRGGRVLHDPGVHRRPRPGPLRRPLHRAARRRPPGGDGLLHRARDAAGAGLRARAARQGRLADGDRPPGHLGQQRHGLAAGRGEAVRLRHRQVEPPGQQDAGRDGQGQRQLHVPRAGARTGGRSPQRSLLAGARPLLLSRRRSALHRARTISTCSIAPPTGSRPRT